MASAQTSVPTWMRFFALAQGAARKVSETYEKYHAQGGTDAAMRPEEEAHVLAGIVLCNVAIESRVDYLIEQMTEEGRLGAGAAEEARRLSTVEKWRRLPVFAGTGTAISISSGPHQAIAKLCELRDAGVNISYDRLLKKLPRPKDVLPIFEKFMVAMSDLDRVLSRAEEEPGQKIRPISKARGV